MKFGIVIGSWGSYNACNSRALGSNWLDLANFEEWEEIEEELKKQGFKLDGIDEELFIQDCDFDFGFDCDYMHPKTLFNILKNSGLLYYDFMIEKAEAFCEAFGWAEFESLVEQFGDCWEDDVTFYNGYDWEALGRELFDEYGYILPYDLKKYFDFEAFGESFSYEGYVEVTNGIIFKY